MQIDIQILLYNSSPNLPLFLKSLETVILKNEILRIHFADQSQSKEEYKRIQEIIEETEVKHKNIKLFLEIQPNYGFGKGHNEIFLRKKNKYGKFFVILNPDTLLMYDTILQMIKYIEAVKNLKWGLLEIEQFPHEHPKYYNPTTLETPWASGAGMIINKEFFEEIGMFDENIFMYGEDVDLSIRMRKRKYKILHLPECKFIHLTEDTDVTTTSDFIFNHKQAAELYLRYKHGKLKDLKAFDDILKVNKKNYKAIKEIYKKMVSREVERKYYKNFVDKNQDYTKFRWVVQ